MKYLFYFNTCFNPTMMAGLLDKAITVSQQPGNSSIFAYCGGVNSMCLFNREGSKSLCRLCSHTTKKTIEALGVKSVDIKDFAPKEEAKKFNYNNSEELRSTEYRHVRIGLSIMSSYISCTRNLTPSIDDDSRKFFDEHLAQNARFVDAVYNLIEAEHPDYVYLYNGRFEDSRPLYDISKHLGIKCVTTEVVRKEGKWHATEYPEHLPHDLQLYLQRRDYCWEHYPMSDEQKIELGKSFFRKRRYGEDSGDKKIYIADQKVGYIPEMKKDKKNILIANSSEDEHAAVGDHWDTLKFVDSQYDGIRFILENAPENCHFYLRVHPNLKNIPYKFHTKLYDLPKEFNNITVVPADSTMSSYSIMEACDYTICFGSTMGAESSFWGKPAILIGPGRYYYDDIVYTPHSKEELKNLLYEELKPKSNINIYKYGAYILDQSPLFEELHHIDCHVKYHYLLGIRYHSIYYMKFWGGPHLTGFLLSVGRAICNLSIFRRYKLPLKEA